MMNAVRIGVLTVAVSTGMVGGTEAQEIWHPPAGPDDVRLESEEMLRRGVVKIVGRWEDGSVETGAGMMLGYDRGHLYLMTAAHVIRNNFYGNARQLFVHFFGDVSQRYRAEVLRYNVDSDIAVLVVPDFYEERHLGRLIKYPLDLAFRYSAGGQAVKAVGHPDDQDFLVSFGTTIPSSRPDRILFSPGMIAPGSSGGPVLSAESRLIGMVTAAEGEQHGIGLTALAMFRVLENWGIPYRARIVEDLDATVEQIRKAVWEDDWDSLTGEPLGSLREADDRFGVWRSKVSVLGARRSIVAQWLDSRTYIEHLGAYGSAATLDEAWRLWLREIVDAIGAGYSVEEKAGRRIAFSKYQGFAWPRSRKVTFEILEGYGDIYLIVYQFETNIDSALSLSRYDDFIK